MAQSKPNILLVTTDQQRWDTCGPARPGWMRTPHIDHLCREGVTFQSAYSECPVCVPARLSIMNGKYAATHGMTGNGPSSHVLGHTETLPARLRACGYQTAAIGKMHFGPQRARHGFEEMILPADYYRAMQRAGHALQPMHHGLGQNEFYPTLATVPEAMTLTSWTAEQCVEYIRERRDPTLPFFLWCSFSKPHPPFDPPEPYYSMYRDSPIADPVQGDWSGAACCPPIVRETRIGMSSDLLDPAVVRAARAAYHGLVTQIDYNLGRVFAALEDMKLFDETLILFTSDHGEMLGDHGLGGKCYFYEGSAHVPFVLRLPRGWTPRCHGKTVSTPVTHADVLPTLLAAAGGEPPAETDGQDLVAVASGTHPAPRQFLVGVGGANVRAVGVTDGAWKYIWNVQGGVEQLFDLKADPLEAHDVAAAAEAAPARQRLREALVTELRGRPGSPYLEGDDLAVEPVQEVPVRDLRAGRGQGWTTEYRESDTRH